MTKFRDEMRARYWALKKDRDPVAAQLTAMKEARDAFVQEISPQLAKLDEMNKAIREFNSTSNLVEMDNTLGQILKALDNKPGPDPETVQDAVPETEAPAADPEAN